MFVLPGFRAAHFEPDCFHLMGVKRRAILSKILLEGSDSLLLVTSVCTVFSRHFAGNRRQSTEDFVMRNHCHDLRDQQIHRRPLADFLLCAF